MTAHPQLDHPLVRFVRAAIVGAAGLALVAGTAGTAVAEGAPAPTAPTGTAGEITDLGVAMSAINVRLSAVGELVDGTTVGYLFSDGNPVSLEVVDLCTGAVLDQHLMEPYTVASGIADEDMLRTLDIDGDTLYGSTYPNATVYSMDLATEEFTEYGRIAPEGNYAWGLDAEDGEVWVGAGTPAQLMTLDPASGATQQIELPADVVESGGFVQRIETYDGRLRTISHRTVNGASAHLRDASGWVGTIGTASMWGYTEDTADGAFYFHSRDPQEPLWSYDVASRTAAPVDLTGTDLAPEIEGTSQMFLTELDTPEFPGTSVIGIRNDGKIWRYNLETGTGDVLTTAIAGAPVTTMSLGEGGDGQLYVGAYLSSGVMARVDPATGEITQLEGPEQADSITAHDGDTFIGTYPEARIYQADGDAEWDWGVSPRQVLELGREASGQDRPRHMISAGDHVAIATIPNHGELGGALTLLDPQTGEHETHRNIIPAQSVTDLAYSDGTVFAGTSIDGALDSTPTAETAEVFAWDVDGGLRASTPIGGSEIFYADDTTICRYTPAAAPTCDREITGEHRGALTIDTGVTCLTGSTGAVTLSGLTVNGSLTCSGNAIAPVGEGNAVRGPATGQCAGIG